MKDIILDTLIDALKLLPFLFVAFLIMEIIEHKFSNKSKKKISEAGKFGPIIGSLFGAVPQCGFSVMSTNLYATRIITKGTLISIYLSTSDEMLPIMISNKVDISVILKIIGIKIIIGMLAGFIIDFIVSIKKEKKDYEIKDFCLEEHCDCEHGILKSSIKHTFSILLFILIFTFGLNILMTYFGEEFLSKLLLKNNILSPFLSSLIGLIPNCAASVLLTELYLNNVITLSSCIAGLLTGAGVGLLVLLKVNKSKKDSFKIITTIYLVGAISGVVLYLLNIK